MRFQRLLYLSFATGGFDMARNVAILETARERNLNAGVTGLLLCRDAVFAQVLEGPGAAVEAVFAGIRRDRRHQGVTVLARHDVGRRLFPNWQMGFFHMSAVEAKLGDGLLRNDDSALNEILARHRATDEVAGIVAGFIEANAAELRFAAAGAPGPVPA